MKTRLGLMVCWMVLATTKLHSAERPANDDFTNRIALSGSSVIFTGTLVGATREFRAADFYDEIYSTCYTLPCSRSVWWSWTATETSMVILEVLDHHRHNAVSCG